MDSQIKSVNDDDDFRTYFMSHNNSVAFYQRKMFLNLISSFRDNLK